MLLVVILSLITLEQMNASPTRVRRQYPWNTSPYYEGSNYWVQQQWNNGYPQNYNVGQRYQQPQYQQPYGYQNTWQYSQYNSPSYGYGHQQQSENGYVTAPPVYTPQSSGYARPKYLATMEPKPTLPVVLERETEFVTNKPLPTGSPSISTTDVHHPTFLERVLGTPLPAITDKAEPATVSTNIDGFFEKDESEIPARPKSDSSDLDKSTDSDEDTSILNKAVPKILLIDGSNGETTTESIEVSTTENQMLVEMKTTRISTESESTQTPAETIKPTETPLTSQTETQTVEKSEEEADKLLTTTPKPKTNSVESTATTEAQSSIETSSTNALTTTTIEPMPITLIATQEIITPTISTDNQDYDLNKLATPDVSPIPKSETDFDSDEEGSASGELGDEESSSFSTSNSTTPDNKSTFTDGIIGLRPPPLPKEVNKENNGVEVVKWSDGDSFIKKLLL